jgi:Lon protease-like protein
MGAFVPRLDDLPSEFPVFPLTGTLLLPHGRLPLNIFEPRYLAMTEDALAAGRMLAMIQPDETRASAPDGPALFSVGCLGRLVQFSETDDGRFLITLEGVIRFNVAAELLGRRGYRRVRGDYTAFRHDLHGSGESEIAAEGISRESILAALRRYFTHNGLDANWETIEAMPGEALVTKLCMACPFEPAEQQALLEAPTETERAAALMALLAIGAADENAGRARSAPGGRAVS